MGILHYLLCQRTCSRLIKQRIRKHKLLTKVTNTGKKHMVSYKIIWECTTTRLFSHCKKKLKQFISSRCVLKSSSLTPHTAFSEHWVLLATSELPFFTLSAASGKCVHRKCRRDEGVFLPDYLSFIYLFVYEFVHRGSSY